MTVTLVDLADRPDLALTTATWRWETFFKDKAALADIVADEQRCAASHDPIPTVLVLLDGAAPIGMVTLCLDDIEGRPDLNPWLAGLYVDPAHRGKGHALRLIGALEAFAAKQRIERLSLYTLGAVGLYAKAGWRTVETFERNGQTFSIMQKHLAP